MRNFIRRIIPDYAHVPLIFCAVTQVLAYLMTKYIHIFDCVDLSIPLDHRIEMRPGWTYIYVLAYVFWIVGYIAIARVSRERCRRLMCADFVSKIIAAACFVFMPTTIERGEIMGSGIAEWMLGVIYTLDTPQNLFPSMHCLFNWLVTRELMDMPKLGRGVKIGAVVFSLLVFVSTLFTRQHYIADIFGGVLTAEIGICVARLIEKRRKCEVC